MGGRLSSPVLVGREDELGRLHEHAAAVREGRPAAVLLGGEAGIGKTRLLTEFTDALDGFTVLAGGCLDLGASALPHAPLVEALRSLARSQPEDALRRLFTGPRAGLRRLVPELARPSDATSEVPGDAGAAALYEGVLSLLETLAGQAPVVLVIEDLHWATATTLDLLSFLVRNLAQVPVLVVGTFRSDELHVRDMLRPVVTELSRLPTVDRLDLAPLTERHLTRQVAEILGHPPDAELMRTVVERSEGNAFYAEELLAAAERADRARLPDSLRDILLDRVARLDADGREVLGVAAVAGRRVDHELLAQVAELPADRLRAGLRGAVRSGLLLIEDDGSHYRFRHAQEAPRTPTCSRGSGHGCTRPSSRPCRPTRGSPSREPRRSTPSSPTTPSRRGRSTSPSRRRCAPRCAPGRCSRSTRPRATSSLPWSWRPPSGRAPVRPPRRACSCGWRPPRRRRSPVTCDGRSGTSRSPCATRR